MFILVKTVQLDVALGEDQFALRIEVFQDSVDDHVFRADVWRRELYRIQSTFPQHPSTGEPRHAASDETVLVDWSTYIRSDHDYSRFGAASAEAALELVLEDVRKTLDHALGVKPVAD